MSQTLLRILSTIAVATALGPVLGTACSPSGASADKPGQSAASGATASGIVGAQVPHDSINSRADAGRILGDSTAKVWVVMVSDFQCPFCKTWHDDSLPSILSKYVKTGKVRLAFLNMPLSIHPNAVPAAEAAMCASVQNKFWPMQDALFAKQSQWEVMPNPAAKLDSLASASGVDMGPWRECMTQHSTRALIQADHDRAVQSGAGSTPTFFVDGQHFAGSDASLAPAIDAALAKAGQSSAS